MAVELVKGDPPQTILVIGGGLGGLAFAQILRHSPASHKYKVLIFERDATATVREQGYQIGINNSGASCLSSIPHVAEPLARTKHKPIAFALVDTNLTVMMSMKQGPLATSPEGVAGLINRRKLRVALADGVSVEWGKKFVSYEETATGVTAIFEDGTRATGQFLVGADGARSRVRAQRCPELQLESLPVAAVAASVVATPTVRAKVPRVADLVASSFIVRALAPGGHTLLVMDYEGDEEDGEGEIASAGEAETTTKKEKFMWSYSFPVNAAAPLTWSSEPTALKQAVDAQAAILGPELATLVHETACEGYAVLPRTLTSIVPTKENPLGKTSTRVTLLGDAAHAMTTHRGIGANTAFADAFDLANALMREDDPWKGIAEYEQTMIKRGFEAVRASKQMTDDSHSRGERCLSKYGYQGSWVGDVGQTIAAGLKQRLLTM